MGGEGVDRKVGIHVKSLTIIGNLRQQFDSAPLASQSTLILSHPREPGSQPARPCVQTPCQDSISTHVSLSYLPIVYPFPDPMPSYNASWP